MSVRFPVMTDIAKMFSEQTAWEKGHICAKGGLAIESKSGGAPRSLSTSDLDAQEGLQLTLSHKIVAEP